MKKKLLREGPYADFFSQGVQVGNILTLAGQIGVDKEGPLAHVWFDNDYLYNMYVNPRRPDEYGVKFVQFCLQFIVHDKVRLYCDDWNVRAQKFFEKIGFEKNSTVV